MYSKKYFYLIVIFLLSISCKDRSSYSAEKIENPSAAVTDIPQKEDQTVIERFNTPVGFERQEFEKVAFPHYLRQLKLKATGSEILLHNGQPRYDQQSHIAVINQNIGNKNLHQCADAVIKQKADYHFTRKEYDKISFHLTNGMKVPFSKWSEGYRIKVEGNKTTWVKTAEPSISERIYQEYLELIFMYAGTASLENNSKRRHISNVEPGDFLIEGGFPGHAILILDKAINENTGEVIVLLAQSYMPAQDLHIVKNPNDDDLSPWYHINTVDLINTPDWKFDATQLKTWKP